MVDSARQRTPNFIDLTRLRTVAPELYSLFILVASSDFTFLAEMDQSKVDVNVTITLDGREFNTYDFLQAAQTLFEEAGRKSQSASTGVRIPVQLSSYMASSSDPDAPLRFSNDTYFMRASSSAINSIKQSLHALSTRAPMQRKLAALLQAAVDGEVKRQVRKQLGAFITQLKTQSEQMWSMVRNYETAGFAPVLPMETRSILEDQVVFSQLQLLGSNFRGQASRLQEAMEDATLADLESMFIIVGDEAPTTPNTMTAAEPSPQIPVPTRDEMLTALSMDDS